MAAIVAGVAGATCLLFAAEADPQYQKTIRPLLNRHCASCHGGKNPEEGLDLSAGDSQKLIAALADLKSLETIAERVRSQTMPPPDDAEPLPEEDRQKLLAWIDEQMQASIGGETNPGRVTIRRLTRIDYRNTIRDLLGVEVDTGEFPSDDVAHGFDNLADVISLPPLLMERYAEAGEEIAHRWYQREIAPHDDKLPSQQTDARQLAVRILLPLQEQAFRRPTTELENHYLLHFFDTCQQQGYTYEESMQASVTRILISPAFLFRIEQDGPIGQNRPLDDFELATRLSYFLWSSMPDEELFALARAGELTNEPALLAQVERMLKDEKVRYGLVENFAGQWLQTRRLQAIRPDEKYYPKFDDALRQAMEAETLRLFETIVREDRPISELLDADYTFVNARLAEHYGIPGIQGDQLQRISLQDRPRRGVLTHASVLAINAHPTRTSPVLRGKWIMEAILGTPPPPPPADVAELEAVQVEGTLRERLEAHRANKACAACHRRMDALGLAFENYDAVGAWRDKDGKESIDPSGELPDGGKFADAVQLIDLLGRQESEQFRRNVAEKMYVYALGRTLSMYDRLPIGQVVSQTAQGDDRVSSLVQAIVLAEPFRFRHNPGRIGIEKLPEQFAFELTGNPDQQSILKFGRNPHAAPTDAQQATFELHTLKKLLKADTDSESVVAVGKPQGGPEQGEPYRYEITAPFDENIYLTFLEGMIGPRDVSDDFLKAIAFVPDSDESHITTIANSSHSWNGSLVGPDNIRPGSVVAFDFDVRLVAKKQDTVSVFLATAGAANTSMFTNAGRFQFEGAGTHRFRQVGRRNANMLDAWNSDVNLVVQTQTQTVVGNVSPMHVVRPQLGISDDSPIAFQSVKRGKTAESAPRHVFNAQQSTVADQRGKPWETILYGAAVLQADQTREYLVSTEHVGIQLVGPHAGKFQLAGDNATDDGQSIRLIGADDEPGLLGGPDPEQESFAVHFKGAAQPGTYQAAVRIVTQAGGKGTHSTGAKGQPWPRLYYVDIPVEAIVK